MNKKNLCLAMSTLFMAFTASAADTSATLNISGTVTGSNTTTASCAVKLSKASVNLVQDATQIISQGVRATPTEGVSLSITGDQGCQNLVMDHRIAYKFTGSADASSGHVLANTDSSAGAAKGVGVGIYDVNGNVINVNDHLSASTNSAVIGLGLVKLGGQAPSAGTVKSALIIQVDRL